MWCKWGGTVVTLDLSQVMEQAHLWEARGVNPGQEILKGDNQEQEGPGLGCHALSLSLGCLGASEGVLWALGLLDERQSGLEVGIGHLPGAFKLGRPPVFIPKGAGE